MNKASTPLPALTPLRFIPFRQTDLVHMCLMHQAEVSLTDAQQALFREISVLLKQVFHSENLPRLTAMSDSYAPINPDRDTRQPGLMQASVEPFVQQLERLLNQANYERIPDSELNRALSASSMFRIRLHVDFSEFSDVLLFCRGQHYRTETLKQFFGLRRQTVQFVNYERVVVYLRYRQADRPAGENGADDAVRPGDTVLKLFKNVPRSDLEMLFPNTTVRMRLIDKLMIGVPAVISGGIVISTKLGTAVVLLASLIGFWLGLHQQPVELNQATLLALLAGLGAFGAYVWKQLNNYKNRRLRFLQSLTRNLYFKNLDNNAGVFYRLFNDAREEETKEASVAYYFLLTSTTALSADSLDEKVQHWFREQWQCEVDFDIQDALDKLRRLGLVTEEGRRYSALAPALARQQLMNTWRDFMPAE